MIGINSIKQGYEILFNKIPELFSNIDRFYIFPEIKNDYALNYGLDDGTSGKLMISPYIKMLKDGKYLELKSYFKSNSSYNYLESSFYSTEKGYLIFDILPYVCAGIRKQMGQKNIDFSILLAGAFHKYTNWRPFSDYNYCERGREYPVCKFNPDLTESYSYENGNWTKYSWTGSKYTCVWC